MVFDLLVCSQPTKDHIELFRLEGAVYEMERQVEIIERVIEQRGRRRTQPYRPFVFKAGFLQQMERRTDEELRKDMTFNYTMLERMQTRYEIKYAEIHGLGR